MNKSKILKGKPSRPQRISYPNVLWARHVRFCGRSELLRSQTAGIERSRLDPISLPATHEPPRLKRNDSLTGPSHRSYKDSFVNAKQPYVYGLERGLSYRWVMSRTMIRDKWPTLLLDNGEAMMIWIGNSASPRVLLDLFGVDDINQVNPRAVRTIVAAVRYAFRTESPFDSLPSQNWILRCLPRSRTSLLTGEFRGGELRSCSSSDKTWMAQRSSSATCWWKTRTTGHSRI